MQVKLLDYVSQIHFPCRVIFLFYLNIYMHFHMYMCVYTNAVC